MAVAKLEQTISLSTQLTQAFPMAVEGQQRRISSKGSLLIGEARLETYWQLLRQACFSNGTTVRT